MKLPIAIVSGGVVKAAILNPYQLEGPDGTQHPASLWGVLSAEEWEERCPGWSFLPLIDNPSDPGDTKATERLPETEWTVTADAVTVTYRTTDRIPEDVAAALKLAQATATDQVNREAGEARARFITVCIGQEGTYLDKGNEAESFLKDTAPSAEKYPYLYAEAEATGQTVEDVATLVDLTAKAWRPINAKIEGLRQGSLKRVRDASNLAELAGVFPIAWPMPS